MRCFFCLSAILLLTGCAGLPEMQALSKPQQPKAFEIKEAITVDYRARGLLGAPIRRVLLPGSYEAAKENALGTYFVGPRCSLIERIDDIVGAAVIFRGGIWIPKEPGRVPRPFVVMGETGIVSPTLKAAVETVTAGDARCQEHEAGSSSGKEGAVAETLIQRQGPAFGISPGNPAQVLGGTIGGAIIASAARANKGRYQLFTDVEDAAVAKSILDLIAASAVEGR